MSWLTGRLGIDKAKRKAKKAIKAAKADPGPVAEDSPDLKAGTMPTYNAAEVEAARKKALLRASMRGGRRSTILSDTSY